MKSIRTLVKKNGSPSDTLYHAVEAAFVRVSVPGEGMNWKRIAITYNGVAESPDMLLPLMEEPDADDQVNIHCVYKSKGTSTFSPISQQVSNNIPQSEQEVLHAECHAFARKHIKTANIALACIATRSAFVAEEKKPRKPRQPKAEQPATSPVATEQPQQRKGK